MKKIRLLFLLCLLTSPMYMWAQFTLASDNAGNYTTWENTNNLGFGFGAWDLWKFNSSYWFLGSASSAGFGDIDVDGKSFGLWGNPINSNNNQSNAQRVLSDSWGDGASFTVDIAIAYRGGNKGIDLWANASPDWEHLWNFNASNDKYFAGGVEQSSWSYSQTSIFSLTVTQVGTDLQISLVRGSDNYSTTITGKTLYAFKFYCGNTFDGNALNNLYFNNLKVTYSDWSKVPENKKVEVTGAATMNADKTVSDLIINSGETSISAAKKLTVTTLMTNNGTLTLNSDATGTATILTPTTISGAGNYKVNQHFSSYRTWYMSSPVASAKPTGMNRIKYYDETAVPGVLSWPTLFDAREGSPVPYGSNSFAIGKGYQVVPDNDDTNIEFSGASLNNDDISIPVTRSAANTTKPGFNLIGNPYPSYLDWTEVYTANSSLMPTSTMWYRTKDGIYDFWTVNGSGGLGTPVEASKDIPPMQAFWIRTVTGGGNISLTNEMRSHAPGSNFLLKAPSTDKAENSILRLTVSNDINTNETVIYFNENASDGFDSYDSPKMFNEDVAIPELYTQLGDEFLVMNGFKSVQMDSEIALGFITGEQGSFSIRANEFSNFDADVKLVLIDKLTNVETNLSNGESYSFESNVTNTMDRFTVKFKSASGTTNLEQELKNKAVVYSTNQSIIIQTLANANVEVYNTLGQLVYSQDNVIDRNVLNFNFNTGVYLVSVNVNAKLSTTKVIVK